MKRPWNPDPIVKVKPKPLLCIICQRPKPIRHPNSPTPTCQSCGNTYAELRRLTPEQFAVKAANVKRRERLLYAAQHGIEALLDLD